MTTCTPSATCRVQLSGVGTLEKLTVGLTGGGTQAAWLLGQVEVTDEVTGEYAAAGESQAWRG